MYNRSAYFSTAVIIAIIILIIVGLTWANCRFVTQNPGGNDFLSRWRGIRSFLLKGQSPYSDETTLEIQEIVYGREARDGEDQVKFVYPFHSIYLIAPFAVIGDFSLARALWMTTLEIAIFIMAAMSISLVRWKLSWVLLAFFLLFTALWYHSVRPVINGNASILFAFFITAGFLAIKAEHDGLAGVLLAFTTIKPQMVVLLIPFVMIWAASWRRWTIIISFIGSLLLLIVSTSLLIPDWLLQNIQQIISYPGYTLSGTPGEIFTEWLPGVGRQMGWLLTILLIGLLFWEWRDAFHKEFRWFLWTACLTLVITNLIGIRTAVSNYIAMFPALVLVLAMMDQRWKRLGRGLVFLILGIFLIGLWWVFITTLSVEDQPIQHPVLFFPLPVFLLFGLYWVKLWAIQPPPFYMRDF